jgi:4-aminobutyrate aminotransferase-like enzyme
VGDDALRSNNGRVSSAPQQTGTFVSGQGLWLTSAEGHEYLDAESGTFNLPFGYSHPKVTAAVADQLSRLSHISSTFADSPAKSLIARLVRHAGAKIDAGWVRDCTGSTAIECAVKMAQKYTAGADVITLYYSHHGQTLFTSAISGDSTRRRAFPAAATPGIVRVPAPYCYRCFYKQSFPSCELLCADRISEIVDHTGQGRLAALIVEPILGNGGNIVLPDGYAERLREYCSQNGILLVADEVQTGLGRTGEILASPASGLDPDIIVLAKGLGGIGLPIGALLARADVLTLSKTEHSFTSGGNLLAIAAAHATLDLLEEPGFMSEVGRKGALLGKLLHEVGEQHGCVGEIRGRGLMWGVELDNPDGTPAPDLANRAIDLAYSRERLILRASRYGRGNVLKVRPALIATESELKEIAYRLNRVLTALEG